MKMILFAVRKFRFMFLALLLLKGVELHAQSCASYTVQRNTGIAYSSIASTGTSVASWRGTVSNLTDDNRSHPVPIGFDFWYLGVRYTHVSISTNGYIDFSTTTYDGNWPVGDPAPQPPGYATCSGTVSYREDGNAFYNVPCGNGSAPNSFDGTYFALAAMYGDLICNSGNTLAGSIRYKTTGTAPNRSFTVEYINMDDKTGGGSDYNFQFKLTETTGAIRFIYGTMSTASVVPLGYACGINGNILTNPPASSELLTQQADNSGTFSAVNPGLHFATPTSDSRLTFTPPVPANPIGPLTFTAVGASAMTLNWTEWAGNETGYVVYSSVDGTNYSFFAQTSANTSSYTASGLNSGTMYWWKVYAVTEGCLSTPCSASQSTTGSATFTSVVTGNWGSPSTWDAGTVPGADDNVIIANTHTVTVNGSYSCNDLTVGQGSSGKLFIGGSTTNEVFTVNGDIKVKSGAVLKANHNFSATHTLLVSGNITNSGIFNMRSTASSLCNVVFNKDGDQSVTGSGGTTSFNLVSMQMGSSSANTLEIRASAFSAPANFLTLSAGTFKLSVATASVVLDLFSSPVTIESSCGIWMNSATSVMNIHSSVTLKGTIKNSAGDLVIGDNADESLISDGGTVKVLGGTLTIAGALDRTNSIATTFLTVTSGSLVVNAIGLSSAATAPFLMDVSGSTFSMTGGSIIIRRAGPSGLGYTNRNTGTYAFSAGTLQVGDAATPAGQIIQLNTDRPVANVLVNSVNGPSALLTNTLTVTGNIDIQAAAGLNCNNNNLLIGGVLNNDGTFVSGVNTVTFNGASAQQITGSAVSLAFYNLTVSNTLGDVSLNYGGDVTVTNTLHFASGNVILNNNNLVISSGNPITGYSNNRFVVTNGIATSGGYLRINNVTSARDFPIGVSVNSYSPVLNFTNSGIADHFNARVFTGVYQNLNAGPFVSANVVNRTWLINESVNGGSNVDMQLQWDTIEELGGFNRANCGVSFYDASLTAWDTPPAWGAASPNPDPQYYSNRSGISNFPGFMVQSGSTMLPVELIRFDAAVRDNKTVALSWETASEHNNDYFTVEQSTDLLHYKPVAVVKGAGNSSESTSYSTYDPAPSAGISYYRLKQTDYDGNHEYFMIRSVKLDADVRNTVAASLTDDAVQFRFSSAVSEPVSITVFDGQARLVYNSGNRTTGADGTLVLYGRNLKPGRYFVNAEFRGESIQTSFTKSH